MFFSQLKGKAIGTEFTPAYVNLTMAYMKFKFMSSLKTLII